MHNFLRNLAITVVFAFGNNANAGSRDLVVESLSRAAPEAKAEVIALALKAARCADARDGVSTARLALIDYSQPSTMPRLWVFDLAGRRLMYKELVAHGRNSGDNYPHRFSNKADSLTSSLGLFRTADAYEGHNGYSLRLAGLEPGINDNAESRAIVMHGAPYVSASFFKTTGRLGRSFGCPAVRPEIAQSLIDDLKGGQYLFAYYPDHVWLKTSPYVSCKVAATPATVASAR